MTYTEAFSILRHTIIMTVISACISAALAYILHYTGSNLSFYLLDYFYIVIAIFFFGIFDLFYQRAKLKRVDKAFGGKIKDKSVIFHSTFDLNPTLQQRICIAVRGFTPVFAMLTFLVVYR